MLFIIVISTHMCSWPHKVTFRRVVLYVVLYVLEVVRRSRLNEIFNRPRAPGRAGAARGMPRMCLIDCPRPTKPSPQRPRRARGVSRDAAGRIKIKKARAAYT